MTERLKSVILTGFMGVGKSTICGALAQDYGLRSEDTDGWMEQRGISVPHLVRTDPKKFRVLETTALSDILSRGTDIIATGGGIVSTEIGRSALKTAREHGALVLHLVADFDALRGRVAADPRNVRPLFEGQEQARALFDQRQPWYEETRSHVVDASQSVSQVAQDIMGIYNNGAAEVFAR